MWFRLVFLVYVALLFHFQRKRQYTRFALVTWVQSCALPISRTTLGYTSDAHIAGAADVARRFGANGEWGLRINGSARRGDIAIDDEFHSSYVLVATLDYDNGPLRAALNLNDQRLNQKYWRGQVRIGTAVPRVPDADTNYSQPWSQILTKDFFGAFSLEYDLSDAAMLYAKVGARDGREDQTDRKSTRLNSSH